MKPPIPVPDPDAEALVFRCKFLHFWLATTLGGLAWGLPAGLILSPPIDSEEVLSGTGFAVVASIAVGSIISVLSIIMAPVKVDANRLRGINFWGKSAQVQWHEISDVRRLNFLTLPYIKISTPLKKNVIWLPLFLTDLQGFRDAVVSFTPPNHPLRLALEKEFQE